MGEHTTIKHYQSRLNHITAIILFVKNRVVFVYSHVSHIIVMILVLVAIGGLPQVVTDGRGSTSKGLSANSHIPYCCSYICFSNKSEEITYRLCFIQVTLLSRSPIPPTTLPSLLPTTLPSLLPLSHPSYHSPIPPTTLPSLLPLSHPIPYLPLSHLSYHSPIPPTTLPSLLPLSHPSYHSPIPPTTLPSLLPLSHPSYHSPIPPTTLSSLQPLSHPSYHSLISSTNLLPLQQRWFGVHVNQVLRFL